MARIGRQYDIKDGKVVPRETRPLDVSAKIRQRKSRRAKVVSRAKAMARAQRP